MNAASDSLPLLGSLRVIFRSSMSWGVIFNTSPYPQASPCHQLQHKSVPGASGPEDDLVNHILFKDLPDYWLWMSEKLLQDRVVTRVLVVGVNGVSDEIEER